MPAKKALPLPRRLPPQRRKPSGIRRRPASGAGAGRTLTTSDPDPGDFTSPEDFYDWYRDDFFDFEEAEDWYYAHGGK